MLPYFFAATIVAAAITSANAAETEHRQYGKHQHGAGKLNIVAEGQELQIELDSPAMNIVGFEHEPRNANEKLAVEKAFAILRDAKQMFTLPIQAECVLKEAKAEREQEEAQPGTDAKKNKADADTHSDINANYRYTCANMSALREIDVKLFTLFPMTEKLKVELVGPKGQKADELTSKKTRIVF